MLCSVFQEHRFQNIGICKFLNSATASSQFGICINQPSDNVAKHSIILIYSYCSNSVLKKSVLKKQMRTLFNCAGIFSRLVCILQNCAYPKYLCFLPASAIDTSSRQNAHLCRTFLHLPSTLCSRQSAHLCRAFVEAACTLPLVQAYLLHTKYQYQIFHNCVLNRVAIMLPYVFIV